MNNGGCGNFASCSHDKTTFAVICACKKGFINVGNSSKFRCVGMYSKCCLGGTYGFCLFTVFQMFALLTTEAVVHMQLVLSVRNPVILFVNVKLVIQILAQANISSVKVFE